MCSNTVKALPGTFKAIAEQLEKLIDKTPEEKVTTDMIFKQQIGRPIGTWARKRERHRKLLHDSNINQPKQPVLEYRNFS